MPRRIPNVSKIYSNHIANVWPDAVGIACVSFVIPFICCCCCCFCLCHCCAQLLRHVSIHIFHFVFSILLLGLVRPSGKECAAFSSHPELLSLLPYVESLEDNEAITASGLCTYSIIHDLKNKAVFDATAGQQTTTANAATKTALTTTSAATTSPISSSSLQQVTFTFFFWFFFVLFSPEGEGGYRQMDVVLFFKKLPFVLSGGVETYRL